jgi:enoyl-CoA hydratase
MARAGTEHCTVERRANGTVVVVTMNRPEAKNALSPAMIVGMADAWQEIDDDDDVRCAILTGAGGTFCAGMDLKSFANPSPNPYQERFSDDPDLHWKALLRDHHLKKPLLAAIEGYAVAGGTELLQATDIRVASESATPRASDPLHRRHGSAPDGTTGERRRSPADRADRVRGP